MADQYGNTVDSEIWVPTREVTLEPGEWVISRKDAQAKYPPETLNDLR